MAKFKAPLTRRRGLSTFISLISIITVSADQYEGGPVVRMTIIAGAADGFQLRGSQSFGRGTSGSFAFAVKVDHQLRSRVCLDRPEAGDNQRNPRRFKRA